MPETSPGHSDSAWTRRGCAFALLALCGWVAWRLGAFSLEQTIEVDGRQVIVPDMFALVDHPFHATRAHVLLEHLRSADIPRWIGNHQGGYPAEFYPLGVAWLDVALWALSFGAFSIVAIHKLAVILIFLLPAIAYWMLSRADGVHPGVAVLAMAIHVAVPGSWLNGGYTELVGWGLVTNVAGASLALIASVALARFVLQHDLSMGVVATLAAAGGAVTNPRSLFALVIATVAVVALAAAHAKAVDRSRRLRDAIVRVGVVGGLALLLAAPVVFALVRYNGEYFFLHYESYDPLSRFWSASVTALSLPILIMAIVGTGAALGVRRWRISTVMAVTLVLYVLFTSWVATSSWMPPLVEQLEAPRLMPYQRLLMAWFAAAAVGWAAGWAAGRFARSRATATTSAAIMLMSIAILVSFIRPMPFVPQDYAGLSDVGTTASREYADLQEAARVADGLRPAGTSIFVIGNRDDWWHHQLWAPVATDTPFYYDDWMWYWTTSHEGPYDYRHGHYFPNPTLALTGEYFDANGIGAVVVTDMWVPEGQNPREAARASDLLDPVGTYGAWDVYTVSETVPLITNGVETPSSISIDGEVLSAAFDDGDGTVVIRRNWFPRWEVLADGEPVAIERRADGYMQAQVEPGPVSIEVRYRVTGLDWAARGASTLGAVGVVVLAVGGRRWFPSARPQDDAAGTIYVVPAGPSPS